MDNTTALTIASTTLISIEIDESVTTAYSMMKNQNIRHLVVRSDKQAIGVISDRDVMKAFHLEVKDVFSVKIKEESLDPNLRVRDVMSWPIRHVDESSTLLSVVELMLEEKISSLLLTKDSAVVGIVTTDDLLTLLKQHLTQEHTNFWGENIVNSLYSAPIRDVMQALSNSGI